MERVSLEQAKADIEDAFVMWRNRNNLSPDAEFAIDEQEALDARARVNAFLAQCEADAKELAAYKAALVDCVELMDHGDGEAYTQALAVLGRPADWPYTGGDGPTT